MARRQPRHGAFHGRRFDPLRQTTPCTPLLQAAASLQGSQLDARCGQPLPTDRRTEHRRAVGRYARLAEPALVSRELSLLRMEPRRRIGRIGQSELQRAGGGAGDRRHLRRQSDRLCGKQFAAAAQSGQISFAHVRSDAAAGLRRRIPHTHAESGCGMELFERAGRKCRETRLRRGDPQFYEH